MNTSKMISVLLILLALLIGTMSVILCTFAVTQQPILVAEPEEASETASQLMSAVRQGDYKTASGLMQGKPDLGVDREPADVVGKLLWDEFLKSFTYEFEGSCYATKSGMAIDMSVHYLDFNSVMSTLGDRAGSLLKERASEAEDPDELYDDENNYRQDLVDEVLELAARDAIREDSKTITEKLTVSLAYEDGHWRVVPDSALIHVISGGTAG